MAGTRSSARLAGSQSSPSSHDKSSPANAGGRKRKADAGSSPKSKRGRKAKAEPQQKTLEETMPDQNAGGDEEEDQPNDIEMKEAAEEGEGTDRKAGEAPASRDTEAAEQTNGDKDEGKDGEQHKPNGEDAVGEDENEAKKESEAERKVENGESTSKMDETGKVQQKEEEKSHDDATTQPADANGAIQTSSKRESAVPSQVLEKGIIYFFVRGRVNVDEPENVNDLQRTYMILHPLPNSAEIKDGPLPDQKNNRLLALPKKVFPKSHRDVFMTFVEEANVSIATLKDEFMKGSDYETKTTGTRHTQPVTPVGEGVYAITSTGRASHLAYMLTIPKQLGKVQEDIGLAEKGSFVVQVKNPTQKGPANASLPQGPDFPKEIMEEFRGLRWMPLQPKHLNYENTQFLLIGEGYGDFGKALEPSEEDQGGDKETPREELEKLEDEDGNRIEHLKGDDSIFEDLKISKEEYPDMLTTW